MSKTKKIFLVNTDPSQNEMLKAYINEHFKFEIVTFTNIEDAIRNLDLPPNVIILDYAMLDVSSALLFKKFKKSAPACFLIALSDDDRLETISEAYQQGFYEIISKKSVCYIRVKNSLTHILNVIRLNKALAFYKKLAWVIIGFIILALTVFILYNHYYVNTPSTQSF